jgi:adenylate kinase
MTPFKTESRNSGTKVKMRMESSSPSKNQKSKTESRNSGTKVKMRMESSSPSKNQKSAIILLGRPGSGKGTQAELLAKKLGFFHFEMSDLLQKIFKTKPNDPEVKLAEKAFYSGKLVAPDFIIRLNIETIKKIKKQGKGIVFDGSFRLIPEAKEVLPILIKEYGRENVKIFNVKVSDRESIWRNTRRKICQKCDSPVPYTSQTKDLKICPRKGCEGKLITRIDDNPGTIKRRLKIFAKQTQPVINYFKKQKLLTDINGEQSIEDVFKDILKAFRSGR